MLPRAWAIVIVLMALATATAFVIPRTVAVQRAMSEAYQERRLIDAALVFDLPAPNDGVLGPGPCAIGGLLDNAKPVVLVKAHSRNNGLFFELTAGRTPLWEYDKATRRSQLFFEGSSQFEGSSHAARFSLEEPFSESGRFRDTVASAARSLGADSTCVIIQPDLEVRSGDVFAMATAARTIHGVEVVFYNPWAYPRWGR